MTAPDATQPAQERTQPVAVPPPAQQQTGAEAALLAALALFLAGAGATSVAGAAVGAVTPAALIAAMVRLGISRRAARLSFELVITIGRRTPAAPAGPGRVAQRRIARDEPMWRAAYQLNAAKRLTRSLASPTSAPPPAGPGTPGPAERLRLAVERERRYLDQHVNAGRNRRKVAETIDDLAAQYGPVLMWKTVLDGRADADCLALHGRLFHIDSPPRGLYPGTVHPTCRCTGVRPPRRRRLTVVPDPGA